MAQDLIFTFQNQTEESLRQELVALQEDKYNYEAKSKVGGTVGSIGSIHLPVTNQ